VRRHDLDLFSLVAGLAFVLVAGVHLLNVAADLQLDGHWVVPVILVLIGVAGLAGVLRGRPDEVPGQVEDGADAG
jgi:hypothetical protein